MKRLNIVLCFICMTAANVLAQKSSYSTAQYREDFDFFWTSVNNEYCYFNKKQTNWEKVKRLYRPMIDSVTNRDQFVSIMEKALYEIYDHHAILNTNTNNSNRLVPSGTDIWAAYVDGKPMILELRKDFGAAEAGIRAGMEVVAINDVPVETAVALLLPKSLDHADNESKSFALRLALAGNHVQPRKISLRYNGQVQDYYPDKGGMLLEHINHPQMIDTKMIGRVGYLRINDCLYDNALIPVFDSAMQTMRSTNGLIIDLRECPSGGNTNVAKAILGWFTNQDRFYQQHEYYATEKELGIKSSWQEIVSPRKNKYYGQPLVILCDHWTGSIAEGITIGFDALARKNTRIIGTQMAGLNGAVYSYEMPNTKIHFSFPAERLYHINGQPRENYVPQVNIDLHNLDVQAKDIFIDKALAWLSKNK